MTDRASLAGGLREAGVAPGDVVAWQVPNRPEVLDLYRACWDVGVVAAPLHHRFTATEVDELAARLDARLVLREPGRFPVGDPTAAVGRPELAGLDELAVVLFTSGSSGPPKGVKHTHRALWGKARDMVRAHGLTDDDVVLMPAPLAHISGLLNGLLVPETAGMRTVLMDKWNPRRALDLIEREGVTFMVGPPTFFITMMEAPGFSTERVASLRLVSSGGAGVTPAFVTEASERLGCVVKRTYGSSEAPSITTSFAGDDPVRAAETDGRVVGEAELRLVDGELWVRGPELFTGYLDDAQTEAAVVDGWFRTGDLARIEDGWLTITGRLKDVVIRGGENVSIGEVEATLEAHPSVRAAAVVGEPDRVMGERVAAFVVADEDFDLATCQAWFEEQGVGKLKWPERVETVEALPVLASGKVDKATLSERLG